MNRIGIDIDGSSVRTVTVDASGKVVDHQVVHGTSPEDAVDRWQKLRQNGEALAVWSGPNAYAKPVEVIAIEDEEAFLPALAHAADESLNAEAGSLHVTGRVLDGREASAGHVSALAVGVDRGELDPLWEKLLDGGAETTQAAVTFTTDSLYLAMRRSTVEVILVEDSVPIQHRQFALASLESIARRVEETTEDIALAEQVRRADNLASISGSDVLTEQLAELVGELRRTVEYWQRSGTAVPNTLKVFGPGAALPGLSAALGQGGFAARAAPIPTNVEGDGLGNAELTFHQALLTAAHVGYVPTFVNPVAVKRQQLADAKAKRHKAVVFGAAAAVAAFVFAVIPPFLGAQAKKSAEDKLATAETELANLADVVQVAANAGSAYKLLDEFGNYEPNWLDIVTLTKETAPIPANTIDEITISVEGTTAPATPEEDAVPAEPAVDENGVPVEADPLGPRVRVDVTAHLASTDFDLVSEWVENLQERKAYDVIVESFSEEVTTGSTAVTFSFALSALDPEFVTPRYDRKELFTGGAAGDSAATNEEVPES